MNKKQSILKEILSNMLETLTPEVEKEFSDYIESTTVRDKAMNFFDNVTEFLGSVADIVGIPDVSDQVASDEFLDRIKCNLIAPFFYQLALNHDLRNYHQDVEILEQNLAANDAENISSNGYKIIMSGLEQQTFNTHEDISVTTYPSEYINDRKSITIVIDYPDYHYNEFTGIFELSILDVDDPSGEAKSLYYDTMYGEWHDNKDWLNEPMEFTLVENSQKGGK